MVIILNAFRTQPGITAIDKFLAAEIPNDFLFQRLKGCLFIDISRTSLCRLPARFQSSSWCSRNKGPCRSSSLRNGCFYRLLIGLSHIHCQGYQAYGKHREVHRKASQGTRTQQDRKSVCWSAPGPWNRSGQKGSRSDHTGICISL